MMRSVACLGAVWTAVCGRAGRQDCHRVDAQAGAQPHPADHDLLYCGHEAGWAVKGGGFNLQAMPWHQTVLEAPLILCRSCLLQKSLNALLQHCLSPSEQVSWGRGYDL